MPAPRARRGGAARWLEEGAEMGAKWSQAALRTPLPRACSARKAAPAGGRRSGRRGRPAPGQCMGQSVGACEKVGKQCLVHGCSCPALVWPLAERQCLLAGTASLLTYSRKYPRLSANWALARPTIAPAPGAGEAGQQAGGPGHTVRGHTAGELDRGRRTHSQPSQVKSHRCRRELHAAGVIQGHAGTRSPEALQL